MATENQPLGPGQRKVLEYVERIRAGEAKQSILEGLGQGFRGAIEKALSESAEQPSPEQPQELSRDQMIADIRSKIVDDLERLDAVTLKEQLQLQSDLVYWTHRGALSDELFAVGTAHVRTDDRGELQPYEAVDGTIGSRFDAHGIAKMDQLKKLLTLLENGIDASKDFHTAPFEVPDELRAAMGAAMGTGGGTAYKDGIAVVTSGYGKTLRDGGIKYVFLNDVYQTLKAPLQRLFPQYRIHLLSEQKQVLEADRG